MLEESIETGKRLDEVEPCVSLLLHACDTRITKLMEISLDALHYLIGNITLYWDIYTRSRIMCVLLLSIYLEHGYLRGQRERSHGLHDETLKTLPGSFMLQVIETVSRCSDEYDDAVQLQVIDAYDVE